MTNSTALSNKATQQVPRAFYTYESIIATTSGGKDSQVWHGELAVARLNERVGEMFKDAPDKSKYNEAVARMKEIWNFSDIDIEGLKYFVCQTREEHINPSLNKSLYIYSEAKKQERQVLAVHWFQY